MNKLKKETVTTYLRELALEADDSKTVRYTRIGSIIEQLDSVFDYYDLQINGGVENLTIPDESVAVLTEVTANVAV